MFQTGHSGEPNSIHIGLSAQSLSVSCTCENNESIVSCFRFGSAFLFKYHYKKVRVFCHLYLSFLVDIVISNYSISTSNGCFKLLA